MITPQQMVEELLDEGAVTKWEDSFLVSISDQLENGRPLTARQLEILKTIYEGQK